MLPKIPTSDVSDLLNSLIEEIKLAHNLSNDEIEIITGNKDLFISMLLERIKLRQLSDRENKMLNALKAKLSKD
jgi:DNA-binding cell septation regulator SpoVG